MPKDHLPVLSKEVIEYLNPRTNENFVDATVGLGGQAEKILDKTGPRGKLLALDCDAKNLNRAKENLKKFQSRSWFFEDNFINLTELVKKSNFKKIKGILFDLGLSTPQLEDPSRGFSFRSDQPLDMRLGRNSKFQIPNYKLTAETIINKYPENKLADILYQYGDVRNSRYIAKKIIQARERQPIRTTFQLVRIIGTKNPKILAPIFQALRIEVNQELENLKKVLPQALELLEPEGRLVVISYHSGEDRIVKHFLRDHKDCFRILTKKPVTPNLEEIKNNPRSRSAKLRAAKKI